jgi:hypothetical protein
MSHPQSAHEFRRCRSLTLLGRPCSQRAQLGADLCVAHARHRFPVCPTGGQIAMPLLEDLPTIRVVATQVAHGLFTQALDPVRAGKILYACQVAAATLPRPAHAETTSAQLAQDQQATEIFTAPEGPNGRYEPVWRHDKYLYEQECERLGKPLPKGPADMPLSGWLTPEEAEDPEIGGSSLSLSEITPYREKMLTLRLEADREGRLPPLRERDRCAYDADPFCKGPDATAPCYRMCDYCCQEREAHLALPPREPVPAPSAAEPAPAEPAPALDLQAVAEPCAYVVNSVNIAKSSPCNIRELSGCRGVGVGIQLDPSPEPCVVCPTLASDPTGSVGRPGSRP